MQGQELKAAKKQLDEIPDPEQFGRRHVVMQKKEIQAEQTYRAQASNMQAYNT